MTTVPIEQVPVPLRPYVTFLIETGTFLSSVLYLTHCEIAALKQKGTDFFKAHQDLTQKVSPQFGDARAYFTSRLFVAQVAAFEVFLQETLALVLRKYPKKLGSVEFRLADILEADGADALVSRAIDLHLNKLMYQKPLQYLSDICDLLSIDPAPLLSDWALFAEAKARRDLGIHNAWKCNQTYLRKVREAGLQATFGEGESVVPTSRAYLDSLHDLFERLSDGIARQVIAKHWPEHSAQF